MTESRDSEIEVDVDALIENVRGNKMSKEICDRFGEGRMEASTSRENEVNIDEIVGDIEMSFRSSDRKSGSSKPCIYKVPRHLRRVNSKAYTPRLVSIGPFHHHKEKYKYMGELKLRYGERFRRRKTADLKRLVNKILERKEEIRSCYAKFSDPLHFRSDDKFFVTMILVDAIFIIELFLSFPRGAVTDELDQSSQENPNSTDPMKAEPWMLSVVMLDLVLLENQLPFFVIEDIYNVVFSPAPLTRPILQLVLNFFVDFNFQVWRPQDYRNVEIKHFTDLLRTFYLPRPSPSSLPSSPSNSRRCNWFRGTARQLITRNDAAPENENAYPDVVSAAESTIPASGPRRGKVRILLFSATLLREAGVKFEKSNLKSFLDIDFDKSNGVLKIPVLELNDSAEARLRNVMAYEQFDLGEKMFVTDYLIFLDFLVNTLKDMDLLIDKEIVVNYLGDSKVATSVVNRLNRSVSWFGIDPKYSEIIDNLNSFGKSSRHRWIAILRHEYFNTPWIGAATIAAFMLLLLTLIQSVCSIFQVV